MPDKAANKATIEPLSGGSGWCIRMNDVPVRSFISSSEPIITKPDDTGITCRYEGETYHFPWPA